MARCRLTFRISILIGLLVTSILTNCAYADNGITLAANDITALRKDYSYGVLVLDFSAVKQGGTIYSEDRTIAHFDITNVPTLVTQATLNIPVANWNPEEFSNSFAVYSFYGDGLVSSDEWDNGTLAHVFTGLGGYKLTLQMDVTSLLQNALTQNVPFLSFNFRAVTNQDSYFLGDTVGLPDPTITLIPEPATLLLLGIGGLAIKRQRK